VRSRVFVVLCGFALLAVPTALVLAPVFN
jgi:hypothetical protein